MCTDIKEDARGWEGSAVAAGTLLHWKQTDSDVYITATSRLQTDLMVMVSTIYYKYFNTLQDTASNGQIVVVACKYPVFRRCILERVKDFRVPRICCVIDLYIIVWHN